MKKRKKKKREKKKFVNDAKGGRFLGNVNV